MRIILSSLSVCVFSSIHTMLYVYLFFIRIFSPPHCIFLQLLLKWSMNSRLFKFKLNFQSHIFECAQNWAKKKKKKMSSPFPNLVAARWLLWNELVITVLFLLGRCQRLAGLWDWNALTTHKIASSRPGLRHKWEKLAVLYSCYSSCRDKAASLTAFMRMTFWFKKSHN